jgi:hypothetical protein
MCITKFKAVTDSCLWTTISRESSLVCFCRVSCHECELFYRNISYSHHKHLIFNRRKHVLSDLIGPRQNYDVQGAHKSTREQQRKPAEATPSEGFLLHDISRTDVTTLLGCADDWHLLSVLFATLDHKLYSNGFEFKGI